MRLFVKLNENRTVNRSAARGTNRSFSQRAKLLLSLIFIFSLPFFSSAEMINFFSDSYALTFQSGISLESGTDAMPQHLGPDLLTVYDQKELYISTGIRLFQESLDMTHEAIYWPTLFEKHNIGTGTIFHYYDYYNIFTELDILTGLYYKFDNQKRFTFTAAWLYFLKNSFIEIGTDKRLNIANNNMAAKLGFEFRPVNKFKVNFDFSSYSQYRYMLFFAPDFNLKFSFNLSENFTTGLEFDVQYVDLFTLSANFNCASIRTFVNMEI